MLNKNEKVFRKLTQCSAGCFNCARSIK